jgi:hypothetical protein
MKKTSNNKKGTMPAGAPKGMNPLAYFNSLKGKAKAEPKQTLKKAQNGGYTVTNADGSPMTTPEGYRPPSVPSYPDFKKLRKTNPMDPAFIQLALNPEKFDSKDVKKYGPKKPSKRMMRERSKESESAPMQTTPYKKGGSVKRKK